MENIYGSAAFCTHICQGRHDDDTYTWLTVRGFLLSVLAKGFVLSCLKGRNESLHIRLAA